MSKWTQAQMWVQRNSSGIIINASESAPKTEEFIPLALTVPRITGTNGISKYDQQRKDVLINTLIRAKERANTALVYLSANDRDPEEINAVNVALEHINIALEFLGAVVES